ncbi:MAG: butyrate kinase [Xanthomonadaceae bacterium]|nr:butyrate kinase [Xanthomonadaceae bacterium]
MILAVNVGSTSVKMALKEFSGILKRASFPLQIGSREALFTSSCFMAEIKGLKSKVMDFLSANGITIADISIIASRGGLQRPGTAGSYLVNQTMCNDLVQGTYGHHPSSLGPVLAFSLTEGAHCRAYAIDPPSTDEFSELARISGIPEIQRTSAFHALSHKAVGCRAAAELGRSYDQCRLVVAHLGGGITIGAHDRGRVIDCTHGLSEGPFSPERAGSLPTLELLKIAAARPSGNCQTEKKLVGEGGLQAYLGTKDALEVESRISEGDKQAALVYESMAYQAAKDIAAMAAVLAGKVDAVVLTGSLAKSSLLLEWITARVAFLGPILVYPGEDEMDALLATAQRILDGEEEWMSYA